MPVSSSIFQEGIIIPPLKFVEAGQIDGKLLAFFLNNVRTADEREGDFAAQVMANLTGIKRTVELMDKYGPEKTADYARALADYAETVTRKAIESVPDGTYEFTDYLDDDGQDGQDIPISVELTVKGDSAVLDFTKSGDQVKGSVNAVRAITVSAAL